MGIDELEDGATFSVLPAENVAISVAAGANATDVVPLALRSASTEEHRGWIDALMSNVWQAELLSDRGHAAALRLQMCFRRWRLRKRCEVAAAKTKKKMNRRGKNKTSKRARRASFAYTAKDNDEINLEEGDVLEDLKDLGDGWAEGRNARTGEVGTFPSSYTDPVAGDEEEEGTRAKEDREDVTLAGHVPRVMSPSPQAPKVVARTARAPLSPGAFFHESPPPVVRRKSPQKVDRGYDHL